MAQKKQQPPVEEKCVDTSTPAIAEEVVEPVVEVQEEIIEPPVEEVVEDEAPEKEKEETIEEVVEEIKEEKAPEKDYSDTDPRVLMMMGMLRKQNKVSEAVKQRDLYSAMNGIVVVNN